MESQQSARSVCPFDCPDTCGLRVTVEQGRVTRVTGDPEHPVTRGLLCAKMQHYEQTVHSPDRLTTPLLRSGPKGTGTFVPISWAEAIQRICTTWKTLIPTHGAEAILPYSYAGTMGLVQRNAGHAFFHALGASRLERTICSTAKDAGWQMIMGDTPGMEPSEVVESDLVILWGINAAATSIHHMRDALAAKRQGAKLWVLDTYQTPTAEAADEVFLLRPGSDGALALALMHVLVRDQLVDQEFIRDHVLGYEAFAETLLQHHAPEAMAPVCGLTVETIERMAHSYARARAPFIRLGNGLSRYGNGAMTIRTITCLPALSGAWQQPGGGLFAGTSTGAAFPLRKVTREDLLLRPTRWVNMVELGQALTKLTAPAIKSLYVYHSNPAVIAPDQTAVLAGLAREDLFTIVHDRFLTDTARYADIVLPATSSLEQEDLYRSYGSYTAQIGRAAIPPIGEAKSNWQVFQLLAQGMGWSTPFFQKQAGDLIEELLEGENPWRDAAISEQLRQGQPVQLQIPSDPKKKWLTPSGRIEILNNRLTYPLPTLLPIHSQQDGYPLQLQPAPTRYALNSSFYEQETLCAKQPRMQLLMHPEDADSRGLMTGQQVMAFNQLAAVEFQLQVTEKVPPGTVVTEGVWWLSQLEGGQGVNALLSQRLTDQGKGSTLYDAAVDVRAAGAQ